MRLSQLRYFAEVCKYSNITKAAQALHVAQPTISVAIRELEQELGISLFHRVKQRIYLTVEGRYFYNELFSILEQLDRLTANVRSMGNSETHIRIGIPPMMGSFLFPMLFSKLKSINPSIQLETTELGAIEVQQLVKDEILDLTMLIGESPRSSEIIFKPIMESCLKIVVNPQSPFACRSEMSIYDLMDEPLVLFDNGFYVNRIVTQKFSEYGITPKIVLETGQINTIKNFIAKGIASSVLIDECVFADENLIKVPITDLDPITIGIGWKQNRILSSDLVNMIDFMSQLAVENI